LEARLSEVAGSIGEESVRRHYRQEFATRLRRLFEGDARPAQKRNYGRSERFGQPNDRGGQGRGPMRGQKPDRGRGAVAGERYAVASPQLAQSPVHRGFRAAIPRREALILQVALNHPWVLHDHFEDLAAFEFRHAETEKLKAAVIDIIAHDGAPDREAMRAQLVARGLADHLGRIEKAITTAAVWGARPEAGPEDVLSTWNQLVALHRQWHSLIKELKDAEQALGQDANEANYSWLRDVKVRLSVIDGTEALIEGFGASSGRAAQSL
jgi:DNA primase